MRFSTQSIGSGSTIVSYGGRRVVTLAGADAARLRERLEEADDEDARQLVLAKATGNFKRGNER